MIVMLPTPPSVNAMYDNAKRGRVKTDVYKAWINEAGWAYKQQPKRGPNIEGPYRVEIHLPKNMRGDIDNRLKAVLDLLCTMGATSDDTHCQSILAQRSEDSEHFARIVVEAA